MRDGDGDGEMERDGDGDELLTGRALAEGVVQLLPEQQRVGKVALLAQLQRDRTRVGLQLQQGFSTWIAAVGHGPPASCTASGALSQPPTAPHHPPPPPPRRARAPGLERASRAAPSWGPGGAVAAPGGVSAPALFESWHGQWTQSGVEDLGKAHLRGKHHHVHQRPVVERVPEDACRDDRKRRRQVRDDSGHHA